MTSRSRARGLIAVLGAMLAVLAACAAPPPAASPGSASPAASAAFAGATASVAPALTPVPGGPAASGVPGAGLEPTEPEQMLLNGMRLDLRGACGPFRDKLQAGAVGEIGCVPASGQARFVEVAAFDTQDTMLAAYFERLSQAGVAPQLNGGACAETGMAEGPWMPGPDDGATLPERGACWIDADSAPVYLTTQPPFVLFMVQGQPGAGPDTARQYAWAGNEDVPGAPAIWREVPIDAEK